MFTVVIFVLLTCGLLAYFRKRPSSDDPPVLPGALPIIGHAHKLIKDSKQLWVFLKEVSSECTKLGGVVSAYLGPITTCYCVTDPEDTLTIVNTCLQKNFMYDFSKPWVGDGLATSALPTWKAHRKLLNPAFSQAVIDGFMDVFNGQARRLVKELEVEVDNGPFNHHHYIRRNVLETSCLTLFGVDITDKNELSNQYLHATEEIFNILIGRLNIFLYSDLMYSWCTQKRKQDECLKILHNMSNTVLKEAKENYLNIMKNRKSEMNIDGPKRKPFMEFILELATEKGTFTDQETRDHVDTMLIASHDTLSLTLLFTMLLAGSYPEVQEKVFKELHRVFGDEDRDVTKQDLTQLVYLEAVIKESIRIYPIAPVSARLIDKDIKLKNCTLLKGRSCFWFTYGLHRHPIWGPDAEEFKPERWLDPATLPKQSVTFGAFSFGRRNCIGKTYALMSMKTTLAHIFRQYRVSGDHTKMVLCFETFLKPLSGYHITIEKWK